jgi:acetoin:2,6-dichlorophenolindophenol oxidoreductase subunit beta
VPEGIYKVPIGKGIYRRRGRDLTIVGASHAIELGLTAANRVAGEGIEADVIDLRTLKPMDVDIIEESVKSTGKLLVVDTGWSMGGVCAEIGCLAAERWLDHLRAPVRRIGLPDIPTPAGFTLEQFYYPDVERISGSIRELARARSAISVP